MLANAVAGGFAVVAFIVNALAPSVCWLEPLRPLSPFRWYMEPDPLLTGLHPANVAVLLGITALLYVVAHVGVPPPRPGELGALLLRRHQPQPVGNPRRTAPGRRRGPRSP